MTNDHTGPGPAIGRGSFAWLIDPLLPAAFEADYYEQRHVHIRREPSPYYDELLSAGRPRRGAGRPRGQPPGHQAGRRRWRRDARASTRTDAGRIQPLEVARHFDAGATIIFNQLHKRVPALARLCAALGRQFSSRVQTNVYLTPPEAQGFAPHWDTHDVFVLQVSGAKRWTIYDTKVSLPLRGQRFERGAPPGAVSERVRASVQAAPSTCRAASCTRPVRLVKRRCTSRWASPRSPGPSCWWRASTRRRWRKRRCGATCRASSPARATPAAERERLLGEKLALVQSRGDAQAVWRRFADEVLAANVPLFTDLLGARLRGDRLTARLTGAAPRWPAHRSRHGRRDLPAALRRPGTAAARRCLAGAAIRRDCR